MRSALPCPFAAVWLLLACAPTIARGAPTCVPAGRAVARTIGACEYGAPVTVGRLLLVPKACRIPMAGTTVDRHTVEIRDGRTGAKRGQTSLPALAVKPGTPPPAVGAIIGGAYPLYVFTGGIAAIDPASRKASLVLKSSGTLRGAVRLGEVLAVVDGLPADPVFPGGALEWTVLDFGRSELLGQQRLAGAGLRALGLATEKGALVAWLRRRAKGHDLEVVAVVRANDGKPTAAGGTLHARIRAPGIASARVLAAKVPAGACPAYAGTEAVVVALVPIRLRGPKATIRAATSTLRLSGTKGCLAATKPVHGRAWAWQTRGRGAVLRPLRCGKKAR